MHRSMMMALAVPALCAWTLAAAAQNPPPQQPRAGVGIAVEPTSRDTAHPGLTIRNVVPDGPGAKAGLQPGDVITKVGDKEISNYDDLVNIVAHHNPGDKLTFHVMREGKTKDVMVTLAARPQRTIREGAREPRERPQAFLGVQTVDLNTDVRQRLGTQATEGAVVSDVVPNSAAERAGLKPDDVITSVNGKPIHNSEDLREIVRTTGVGKEVTLKVTRGKDTKEIKAKLEEVPSDIQRILPLENPPRMRGLPSFPPNVMEELQRLQRRVEELENRVKELERKRSPASK